MTNKQRFCEFHHKPVVGIEYHGLRAVSEREAIWFSTSAFVFRNFVLVPEIQTRIVFHPSGEVTLDKARATT